MFIKGMFCRLRFRVTEGQAYFSFSYLPITLLHQDLHSVACLVLNGTYWKSLEINPSTIQVLRMSFTPLHFSCYRDFNRRLLRHARLGRHKVLRCYSLSLLNQKKTKVTLLLSSLRSSMAFASTPKNCQIVTGE